MRELVKWMYDDKYGKRLIGGVAGDEWGLYDWEECNSIRGRLLHLVKSIFQRSPKSPHVANLVAPRGHHSTDGLSRWIAEEFIPSLHDIQDLRAAQKQATRNKGDVEHQRGKDQQGEQGQDQQKQQDKGPPRQQGRALDSRVVSRYLING